MKILTRIFRHIFRIIAFLVLTVVVLTGAIFLLGGYTTAGGNIVASLAVKLLSNENRTIALAPPGPLLTGHLRLPSIQIGDADSIYAEATEVVIDWSPQALLSGVFKASAITAATVEVTRAPRADEAASTTDNQGSLLPIRVDIDRVEIGRAIVGQALAGRRMELSLKGSVAIDESSVISSIAATELAAVGARLNADLAYVPAANRLDLDLALQEPQGGTLSGLLRLPGQPAFGMTLKGEGPLSDWKATFTASITDGPTLSLAATHKILGPGLRQVTANGNGRFDALLPPTVRALFEGDTGIDFAASISNTGQLDIERGILTTASLSLAATGRYDPTGTNDLRIDAKGLNGAVPFEWPLAEGALKTAISDLRLSVIGPADAVALDLKADLDFAEHPQGRLEGVSLSATSAAFNLSTRSGEVMVDAAIARSRFTEEAVDRAIKAPARIKAPLTVSPERIAFAEATIESASIGGSGTGEYDLVNGSVDATVKLFALPGVLPPTIAEKFTGTIALSSAVSFQRPDTVALSDVVIRSSLFDATGSATLGEGILKTELQGTVPELGQLLPDAQGAANVTVSAEGPLQSLDVTAKATTDTIRMAGYQVDGLTLDASGTADPNALAATIAASGQIDGKPIDAAATLRPENGGTVIPDLSLSVGPNKLSGALRLDANFRPDGAVTFDFPDISLLAALAGQRAEGDLKGNVRVDSSGNAMAVSISAAGTSLRRDNISLTQPEISLAISDLAALAANGTVKASALSVGANRVDAPTLAFTRRGSTTDLDLSARYDNAPVTAKASVEQQGTAILANIASFQAAPRGIAISLTKPTSVRIADGTAEIAELALSAGGGQIRLSGKAGETLDLTGTLSGLPAAIADTFSPGLGATGTISGEVSARGSLTSPNVDYRFNWSAGSVTQLRSAGLPPVDVAANGTFAGDRLQVDLTLSGASGLSVRGGGNLSLTGARAIQMNFNGSVPFALVASQLAAQGLTAEGSGNLTASISGNLPAPAIAASISANGIRLVDVRRNLAIEGLGFNARLEGDRVTISGLSGSLASGGGISGSGTIDIRAAGFPADISLILDKASYVDGTMLATTASGTLRLQGPLLSSPVLSGAVTLDKTSITIPERLPPSLAQLDVTHRNAPAKVKAQLADVTRKESNGSGSQIGLDLRIDANSQIYVRGRGVDAELGGALTIRGTAAAPEVSGAFTLRRGRLSILTKRLEFTSATITFGGALIPILEMTATTTSGATTITVGVSGPANDPEISFSSSPALPQDEILAQLIFGQSMAKLSPLQIAQLADSVSQLAGGRSTSLFQSLRSGLGVDDLDVGTDERGNARVTAGKYLNDRTYLEVQQDSTSGAKAVINLDIGRGLKLKGEAGAGGGGGGIFYEKEY
ncbi:translocation/assembly module TamB domain-containing protein [Rhizobium sp. RU36D]|uniref:translocation/assembly module TamB domain-containing protein n=1 Tax=Rhizobium sp. RU36D TaxID=1907415 RepID=UPI0009D8EAD5|nr:translocation/assembly module TamB domain-containing protein [Rhizobium sp. RU36D]SMC77472.1 autotransporter secretion inner membrane protein TamB [Rhizobium sp. RU36D]